MRLSAVPPEVLAAVLVATLFVALVQSARLAFARWLPGRRLRLARTRGAEGELRAEPLLHRLGYLIVARQAPVTYEVVLDGERHPVDLRVDFLVERDGRRFIAEVKTGRLAPRLDTPATRRQLLEYRVAFDVAGVLLVDVDAGRVHTVEFPMPLAREAPGLRLAWIAWIALGAALGFGVAAVERGSPRRAHRGACDDHPARPHADLELCVDDQIASRRLDVREHRRSRDERDPVDAPGDVREREGDFRRARERQRARDRDLRGRAAALRASLDRAALGAHEELNPVCVDVRGPPVGAPAHHARGRLRARIARGDEDERRRAEAMRAGSRRERHGLRDTRAARSFPTCRAMTCEPDSHGGMGPAGGPAAPASSAWTSTRSRRYCEGSPTSTRTFTRKVLDALDCLPR